MTQRTFGPYELLELLGRGGMGDVWRARDTRRGRLVALKLLPGSTPRTPHSLAISPDGRYLYTAAVDGGVVQVVDTATGQVTAEIPTGASPTSVSVTPDGTRAYVTDLDDGTVRILDTAAV